jgi:hypothetical protein
VAEEDSVGSRRKLECGRTGKSGIWRKMEKEGRTYDLEHIRKTE